MVSRELRMVTSSPAMRAGTQRNVLITGGLGFIGTHLADAFIAGEWHVTLLDSMVASVNDGSWYAGTRDVTVLRTSVEDYFSAGPDVGAFDLVVHAASHVGPAGILKYSGRLGQEIVGATHVTIEACLTHRIPLVTFSSAEVYGRSGELGEDDSIIVPMPYSTRIEYAAAKTLSEIMTLNSRHRGLKAIVVRPFNVTGPRQSRAGGFVVPTFVQQAQAGAPMTVFAGGAQTRAFLDAADLGRFFVDHLDAAFATGRPIFNLGNPGNKVSVLDLAHKIRHATGSKSEIRLVDAKQVYGKLYEEAASVDKVPVLDAALAAGWTPRIGLDELIERTVSYYSSNLDVRARAHA